MKRSTRTHDLKVVVPYFGLLQEGIKDFEIHFDDRDFLVDDILNLQEYKYDEFTGECVQKHVKYILRRFKGLQTGYVVLGLEDIKGTPISGRNCNERKDPVTQEYYGTKLIEAWEDKGGKSS